MIHFSEIRRRDTSISGTVTALFPADLSSFEIGSGGEKSSAIYGYTRTCFSKHDYVLVLVETPDTFGTYYSSTVAVPQGKSHTQHR